jgi:hypothetical protein
MRILSVVKGYPTQRAGGMLHVAQDRAEALAAAGHEVFVATSASPHSAGVGHSGETVNGVHIGYTLGGPVCNYSQEFADHCVDMASTLKPDVIHLDSADFSRIWWSDRPGNPKKIAITLHGVGFGGWLTKWNQARVAKINPSEVALDENKIRAMLREAEIIRQTFDVVIGISSHERDMLADQYGVFDAKLVYNPIAPYFFDSKHVPFPPGRPRMLCAAISGHAERMFDVAKAAADRADVELVVAQNLPRRKLVDLYDSCVAVVDPTAYAQGYDLTIAEALARKRWAIVSGTGSYYRESNPFKASDVLLYPIIRTPLGDVGALAGAMKAVVSRAEHAIYPVPGYESNRHKPDEHATQWLRAIGV